MRPPTPKRSGFLLVEVLIAAAILTIAYACFAGSIIFSARTVERESARRAAAALANSIAMQLTSGGSTNITKLKNGQPVPIWIPTSNSVNATDFNISQANLRPAPIYSTANTTGKTNSLKNLFVDPIPAAYIPNLYGDRKSDVPFIQKNISLGKEFTSCPNGALNIESIGVTPQDLNTTLSDLYAITVSVKYRVKSTVYTESASAVFLSQ